MIDLYFKKIKEVNNDCKKKNKKFNLRLFIFVYYYIQQNI